MQSNVYKSINSILYDTYTSVASDATQKASGEAKSTPDEAGVKNVTASFDGTWQWRGYSSLNGVASCIVDGKVVDYAVMCKVCPRCKYWQSKENTPAYNEWKRYHNCSINQKRGAGSMDVSGVKAMFLRSVSNRNLRYTTYLGDGDSKSHQEVVNLKPYLDHNIVKEECIGHVQKRVGARLGTYKAQYKGKLLSDKKKFSGTGRCTNKLMNTLQNYGMIIRTNVENLYGMKNCIAAIVFHCSAFYLKEDGEYVTDDNGKKVKYNEKRHQYCPRTADTWCKYQNDKNNW